MVRTTQPKVKRSYSLSTEAIAFLEHLQHGRKSDSVSAVLEEIIQEVRLNHERRLVENAVTDYYSSLSEDEIRDHAAWGEFASKQMLPGDAA